MKLNPALSASLLTLFFFLSSGGAPCQEARISIVPQALGRGSVGKIEIQGLNSGTAVYATFDGKAVVFFPLGNKIIGLFPADVMLSPGRYPLDIKYGTTSQSLEIQVRDHNYGEKSIKVPKSQNEEVSKENIARANREQAIVTKILATRSPDKLWQGSWSLPLGGEVINAFGRQSRINGILSPNPHSGVDLKAKEGTEVAAPNNGVVLLSGSHFFAGNSVYVDHGQGIISMYFHLSDLKVKTGDKVKKGQLLALSGKTGRVSGPYLHYGIYFCGARIDPVKFHHIISTLKE